MARSISLLLLDGSPVVAGNTSLLLMAVADGFSARADQNSLPIPSALRGIAADQNGDGWQKASAGFFSRTIERHDLQSVLIMYAQLNSMRCIPCQSCGSAPEHDWCYYPDDLTPVLAAVAGADAIVIGTPIHFDAVSAQAKLLIDRCNCFRPPDWKNELHGDYRFIKRLPSKRPGGMVLVGGPDAWFEGARRCIAGFFKWIEVSNLGDIQIHSHDYHQSGQVQSDLASVRQATLLGEKLFDALQHPDS